MLAAVLGSRDTKAKKFQAGEGRDVEGGSAGYERTHQNCREGAFVMACHGRCHHQCQGQSSIPG